MSNIGHNNPPDPIDVALAPYGYVIEEAGNWLDGEPVQYEYQLGHGCSAKIYKVRDQGR